MRKLLISSLVFVLTFGVVAFVSEASAEETSADIKVTLTAEELEHMLKMDELKKSLYQEKQPSYETRPVPNSPAEYEKVIKMNDPVPAKIANEVHATANIPWNLFTWGDIVVGYDSSGKNSIDYGTYRHGAMWHQDNNLLVSAHPETDTVRWEYQTAWNSTYEKAAALVVSPASMTNRKAATTYAAAQMGEEYNWSSPKNVAYEWYCTKLPWAGFKGRGYDIDANGGYWVTPDDIYNDNDTGVFFSR